MNIIEAKEDQKEKWNDFVKASPNSSLLQSFKWGEFQEVLGRKIWKLVMKKENQWLILSLVVKHNLPMGRSYLYCPQGPIFQNREYKIENTELLFDKIKELAKKEKAIFLRIDPAISISAYGGPVEGWQNSVFPPMADQPKAGKIQELGLIKTKKEIQPKDTLILDITKSEDELLSHMHHKTRYNIRLAERKGVKVRQSTDSKDIDIFWHLMLKTAQREKFKSHSREYYKKQLEVLGKEGLVKLFLAEYQGKIIASNIVSFFGSKATYLHGASLYQYREVMAPHLLQWQAILEAKKQGCTSYDFWGIAPKDSSDHPWAGITRFKKGFGGKEIHYIGAHDLVFQPIWYKLYNLAKLKIK